LPTRIFLSEAAKIFKEPLCLVRSWSQNPHKAPRCPVFSQHPHRAPRGRITLSPQTPPPPSPFQSSHSESYSCLPNRPRQPTLWHTYTIYFWTICTLYL